VSKLISERNAIGVIIGSGNLGLYLEEKEISYLIIFIKNKIEPFYLVMGVIIGMKLRKATINML